MTGIVAEIAGPGKVPLLDAIEASCGVNAAHGLRRKPGDKMKAVGRMYGVIIARRERGEDVAWRQDEVAARCGVSLGLVSQYLKTSAATLQAKELAGVKAMGRDGKLRPIVNEPTAAPAPP